MYKIIQNRKIWISVSGVLVVASLISLMLFGLNFGIDFTGGSLLEVRYNSERPSIDEVKERLSNLELKSLIVQEVDDDAMIFRFQNIDEETHQLVLNKLKDAITETPEIIENKSDSEDIPTESTSTEETKLATGSQQATLETSESQSIANLEEMRFDSVGPSIGQELKRKSIYAIILVLIAIVLYIAYAFRKISKPVASWKFGLTAIIALFHDVIITMGIFALLGEYMGIEVNTPFVAAILTVLGYSVNDTIVVFDRIRENLPRSESNFEETINISVNQTITRSINTSVTTLLVLLSIFFFGGTSIRDFILALSIGVFIGTYSSIFLASPVLVIWDKFRN